MALPNEAGEVPVDKQEVEASWIGDEYGLAFKRLDPFNVGPHRGLGFLKLLSACRPCFRLGSPPLCCFGVCGSTVQCLQVRGLI